MMDGRYLIEQRVMVAVAAEEADLVTLTEAGRMLGLGPTTVGDLVSRGVLRRVVDTSERNPRRAGRVYRAEVEAELKRRRARVKAGDGRIGGRALMRGGR